jgi:transcriptional regulator GlxA family with amidase domain
LAAKGGLANWQIRRVTDHVGLNLSEPLPNEELAALARLSTGHFSRAFKVSMGETPHAYIVRQRVRHAQRLMLETSDSLSQIACACGLADQAHLSRLFRKIVGTSPLSWRRDWSEAA